MRQIIIIVLSSAQESSVNKSRILFHFHIRFIKYVGYNYIYIYVSREREGEKQKCMKKQTKRKEF